MGERRRDQGSYSSKEFSGFLQVADGIKRLMKIKKLDIGEDINLSMVNLREPIEEVNLYMQGALQRGVNAFVLNILGEKDLEKGDLVTQKACLDHGLIELARSIDDRPKNLRLPANSGFIVLIKTKPQ